MAKPQHCLLTLELLPGEVHATDDVRYQPHDGGEEEKRDDHSDDGVQILVVCRGMRQG